MRYTLIAGLLLLTGCTTYNVNTEFPNARINIAVETPVGVIYPQTIIRDPNSPWRK